MTTNNFISIKDTALILGVTKQTLRNWDNAGKLKAHRHPFNTDTDFVKVMLNYLFYSFFHIPDFISPAIS